VAAVGMLGAIAGFLIWNYPRGLISSVMAARTSSGS